MGEEKESVWVVHFRLEDRDLDLMLPCRYACDGEVWLSTEQARRVVTILEAELPHPAPKPRGWNGFQADPERARAAARKGTERRWGKKSG